MKSSARLIVPEVVQTSNMDCGPAALKCLLGGFGINVHYGRLREACQTDVDGTSIDTIEDVANQLGLQAEQIMLPADHVLLNQARALPAIAVVVLPNGLTHFVVVWRRHGQWLQLMDPATGRRFTPAKEFLNDLYIHKMPVPAEDWCEYALSESFLSPLRRRIDRLGVSDQVERMLRRVISHPDWQPIAALDAAVRMVESIASSGALTRGRQTARVLESFLKETETIPDHYWSVRSAKDQGQLLLRGAVLVRALGRWPEIERNKRPALSSPELIASLQQPPARPGMELLRLLRADGVFAPASIIAALALASAAVVVEAILFRTLIQTPRLGVMLTLIAFSIGLLLLEIPLSGGLLRMGRHLEIRLRQSFLRKIPHLGDRY